MSTLPKGWTEAKDTPATTSRPQIPDSTTQVSPYLRTTLPLPLQYQPDTLKQFNRPGFNGFRIAPLAPNALPQINSASAGVAHSILNVTQGGGLPTSLSQSTIGTNGLSPGASQTGTITMAPVFTLVFVKVSSAARVRLYSTQAACLADVGRSNSVPPTPGLANYVISDHYLTGIGLVPLAFPCSPPCLGASQDVSPGSTIYYTVNNLASISTSITVTLLYLQMEKT
jgi:hypothetical protein